jgi:hypothetical protein
MSKERAFDWKWKTSFARQTFQKYFGMLWNVLVKALLAGPQIGVIGTSAEVQVQLLYAGCGARLPAGPYTP